MGSSPGLVWAHGVGGSCAADDLRGVGAILNPQVLGRTVLRLDLRGHGRSAGAHDVEQGTSQYTWTALARDLRIASQAALSRAFFGGEAMGAAVALQAAMTATATGSRDAPPGLILMRPPALLAPGDAAAGAHSAALRRRLLAAAEAAEAGGMESVEAYEAEEGAAVLDGAAVVYSGGTGGGDADASALLACRRAMAAGAYAAALRGHAASAPPGAELQAFGQREEAMAADAYGVPLTLQCSVLVLAVPGDEAHPIEAAEALAARLPGAELVVSPSPREAHASWGRQINAFLRKAWMKEFLSKRVMPQ